MKQDKTGQAVRIDRALDEEGIKALVLKELRRLKRIDASAVIATEYPLKSLRVRADLAVLSDIFTGVEIKSAYDSVRRLDRQLRAYHDLFDKTILVLASKHAANLRGRIPANVEVWEISDAGVIKKPQRAPKIKRSDVNYLAFMTKSDIKRFACGSLSMGGLRAAFFDAFRLKFKKTSEDFWSAAVEDIGTESLFALSRFKSARKKAKMYRDAEEVRWGHWLEVLMQPKPSENQSFHTSSVSYRPELSP